MRPIQRFRRQGRAVEFELCFAHHGEEALLAIAAAPDIDLLLLDINMGLTLLSVLRERQSPVRSIIISAYGDMANIRTATNRGAFDFVTKPVDLADLEITIRKTLDEISRWGRCGARPWPSSSSTLSASPGWPNGWLLRPS